MINMIVENNMISINSMEECRGTWTRSSGWET